MWKCLAGRVGVDAGLSLYFSHHAGVLRPMSCRNADWKLDWQYGRTEEVIGSQSEFCFAYMEIVRGAGHTGKAIIKPTHLPFAIQPSSLRKGLRTGRLSRPRSPVPGLPPRSATVRHKSASVFHLMREDGSVKSLVIAPTSKVPWTLAQDGQLGNGARTVLKPAGPVWVVLRTFDKSWTDEFVDALVTFTDENHKNPEAACMISFMHMPEMSPDVMIDRCRDSLDTCQLCRRVVLCYKNPFELVPRLSSSPPSRYMLSRHVVIRTLLRPMHLLFIRHAESVDNVAGLYGGSRDAALTAHGVLQTKRLASGLVESELLDIRHVFSSPLERAAKTAKAICDARNDRHGAADDMLRAIPVSELREKHFGNWEGVKYAAASTVPRPAQIDAETSESMRSRANFFLDQHLWPVLAETLSTDSDKACVIVVSHGILLGALTRALAEKLAHGSPLNASFAQLSSSRLAWSNTGYLDIAVARQHADSFVSLASRRAAPWSWTRSSLVQVNCTKHLAGLHKTRGGIGSAAHDHRQKTLEGFFGAASRKRKAHDATE
ncbi:hypothetical protein C2857_005122 [Epichloe festucae Fl1]|uniref:Phosphoglycerate mutase family protein n=1 Tax=Epichloe festucae (strain Fl1) TaxID=877507 RepID=A0A7U3SNS2_EPIFF|nr:hypothetical protein C2857_005122 [Epichloe festucae Fl1]